MQKKRTLDNKIYTQTDGVAMGSPLGPRYVSTSKRRRVVTGLLLKQLTYRFKGNYPESTRRRFDVVTTLLTSKTTLYQRQNGVVCLQGFISNSEKIFIKSTIKE